MLIRTLALAAALLAVPAITPAQADVRLVHRTRAHRVVHVHRHGCCRYVPARYETRVRRVSIPGYYVERVVPAEFDILWSSRACAYVRVEVRPRRVVRTWVPERVEVRRQRVRVPARWICR